MQTDIPQAGASGLKPREKGKDKEVLYDSKSHETSPQQARGLNDTWNIDFAINSLFNGKRIKVLLVNILSRECLGIKVGQGLEGTKKLLYWIV